MIARVLEGAWREDAPATRLDEALLTRTGDHLLKSGGGALAWRRIRGSDLARTAVGRELKAAFQLHALHAVRMEAIAADVIALLRAAGVETLLVKGWAVSRLYPETGLRPYGDIDLFVGPGDVARTARLAGDRAERLDVHGQAHDCGGRTLPELHERSRVVRLGTTPVRVLGPEDQLRHLCLHMLRHSAWRPLWLCDVAVVLESLPRGFDWDLCLGPTRLKARQIECVVALAHRLLGASLPGAPGAGWVARIPTWLEPAVLGHWARLWSHYYEGRPLASYLHEPGRLRAALSRRWPSALEATVRLGAPFDGLPRLPIQLADVGIRFLRSLAALPRALAPGRAVRGRADRPVSARGRGRTTRRAAGRAPLAASVIVPTRGGADRIAACLEALCGQDLPASAYEVLVVDDASEQSVAPIVERVARAHPDVNLATIRLPGWGGISRARNVGIRATRGSVVLFVDDDAIPDPDWISRILERYRCGGALAAPDGVGGGWRPAEAGIYGLYFLARTYVDDGRHGERLDGAGGVNMSFARAALEVVGGFDPLFTHVSDDADINRRMCEAGRRLVVDGRNTVARRMPASLAGFVAKMLGRGAGSHAFHLKYASDPLALRGLPRLAATPCVVPLAAWCGWRLARAVGRPRAWPALSVLWLVDHICRSVGFAASDLAHRGRTLLEPLLRVIRLGLRNGVESLLFGAPPWRALCARRKTPAGPSGRLVVASGPVFSRSWGGIGREWVEALSSAGLLRGFVPAGSSPGLVRADLVVAPAGYALELFERYAATAPTTVRVLRRECTHRLEVHDRLAREARRWCARPDDPPQPEAGPPPPDVARDLAEYALADAIVVPSRFSARGFMSRGVRPSSLRVLRPGVDARRFGPGTSGERSRTFRAVFVGLVGLRKGVAHLLSAWSAAPGLGELVLVGPVQEDLPAAVRPLLSAPGVAWRRRVSSAELVRLYRSAWVVCLPSIQDGWGLSAHEAMACGTPVVVSDAAGVAELVEPGVTGRVVPAGQTDPLREALADLARDRSLIEAMGERARVRAAALDIARYRAGVVALVSQLATARTEPRAEQVVTALPGARQAARSFAAAASLNDGSPVWHDDVEQ
jgi:glycosyltransferase involved in cell wall biosynthesis